MGHGRRVLTPFVGRQRDLALLSEHLDAAVAGQGQVVGLVGEPGMGKSRLLAEFRRLVRQPVRYVEGHCLAYGSATPYLPVLDLVRQLCGMTEEDPRDAITAKVHQRLHEAEVVDEAAVPLLLQLLDIPIDTERLATLPASARKARTFALLRQLVVHEVQRQPCVVVIENLHWSDATSEEWLTSLVERLAGVPLLLLVTYRPGYQPPWLTQSYATQIALPRLRPEASRTLVLALHRSAPLPEALIQEILTQAAGNPFFLEELVLHVAEQGIEQPPLRVPATLQAVLAARIDRLSPGTKGVLRTAAVIGTPLALPLLQAVTDFSAEDLHMHLRDLQRAELLYETGRRPAGYTFKHALVQEVAYQSLLEGTRQLMHLQVAQRLESQFADIVAAQPELVAHHYTEAGCAELAVGYWQQAGERALQGSANQEAISHLTRGLKLLATLPEQDERAERELGFQMALGPALKAAKGFGSPEVEQAYMRARELCQHVKGTSQLFPALWGLCTFYATQGMVQIARELGEQLLTLAQMHHDAASLLTAHVALGTVLYRMGEFAHACRHLEEGITFSHLQQERALAVRYGTALGVMCRSVGNQVLWALGYPDKALRWGLEACTLAQELDHPYSLAYARPYTVQLHMLRGEVQTAHEQIAALTTLATQQSLAQRLAMGICLRGWVQAAQGQVETGIEQMHQGLTDMRRVGSRVGEIRYLALMAEAYGSIGRVNKGLHLLTEAQVLVDENGVRHYEAECYRLKGRLLLQQSPDNTSEAEACFQQAIAIAQNQSAKSWELRAATSLATLWQQQNRRQDAYNLLASVYGWFTEGFDTADLIAAKALLDELADGRTTDPFGLTKLSPSTTRL
jgi:predicted ATPase